jgi:hypothetical protein
MNLQYWRDSVLYHGLGPTLYHAAYRAANHLTGVAAWNALVITPDMIDKKLLPRSDRVHGRMVESTAMRPYVADAENLLTDRFVDEASARGDQCYVLFDGDTLASYGWYSTRPTRLTEIAGAPVLHFDPSYAYMYNTFTRPEYRGRRLHGVGMAAALEECTRAGLSGLVAYVVSSNFASLKSCQRLGFQTFGHLIMLEVGAHQVWRVTPGCKKYGFRVEAAAS